MTAPVWRYAGAGLLMTLTPMLPLLFVMVTAALFTSGMISTARGRATSSSLR
jgi:hypothetical protein